MAKLRDEKEKSPPKEGEVKDNFNPFVLFLILILLILADPGTYVSELFSNSSKKSISKTKK